MDIKRSVSPQLGDDLVIRIRFGEIRYNKSPSPISSPLSNTLTGKKSTTTSTEIGSMNNTTGRENGFGGESKTKDIELTQNIRGHYQEVPKDENRKVAVLEDPRDGVL